MQGSNPCPPLQTGGEMKITKELFFELTGEFPEDVFGKYWTQRDAREHLIDCELLCSHCGQTINEGACFYCKRD